MSHESESVPAPNGGRQPHVTPLHRLIEAVRGHVTTWPQRYVEMRTGRRRP